MYLTQNLRDRNNGARTLKEVCLTTELDGTLISILELTNHWPHIDYQYTGSVWVEPWMTGMPLMFPNHDFDHSINIPLFLVRTNPGHPISWSSVVSLTPMAAQCSPGG